jgi:DNA-binding response OmpR family regulator
VLRRSKSDPADQGPTRVLIVNDDADACELVARIIESAGWAADRAHSSDEALESLLESKPVAKAVLIDFTSGGTGMGLNLLDTIRRTPGISDLVVVLLTRTTSNRVFAWESGADGFLVRPFHGDDLINELTAVFARSPDEREAYRQEQLASSS